MTSLGHALAADRSRGAAPESSRTSVEVSAFSAVFMTEAQCRAASFVVVTRRHLASVPDEINDDRVNWEKGNDCHGDSATTQWDGKVPPRHGSANAGLFVFLDAHRPTTAAPP